MKKNFIKKQDFLLKLLSLALSIVLWAVVMDIDNPERNMRFDDVPVRVIGASQLKASTGLELIEGENTTVTVSLRGQSKSVGEVRASQITATVDISGLTEANEYDLPVTVSVSKSGVETNYVNPGKVHVRVDRVESKDVPIEVNVTGTPSDGYRAGKPTAATKKVTGFRSGNRSGAGGQGSCSRGCYRPQFLADQLRMQDNPV